MGKRRLAIGVVAIAAVLLGGRALSLLYDSFTWYESLGARSLWMERAMDTVLVVGAGFIFATLFALANLAFLRRAVGSLSRPRRLANVEFGEAIPASQLRVAGIAVAVGTALALTPLLPSWKSVALAKLGVDFREAEPYFQHDLSFYVAWLPLERALYSWTLALVVSVSVLIVALYIFASAIKWKEGILQLSPPVRRHLGILASLLLLVCTWSYRLDSYELLSGRGKDVATFSYFDHKWMLPGLLALSLATAATAVTVMISSWMGQLRTSLLAIMVAIGLACLVKEVSPFVFLRVTSQKTAHLENAPYLATKADFTRRAFGAEVEDASDPSPFGALTVPPSATNGRDSLVVPGATGTRLIDNPTIDIAAPSLGMGLGRLAHAWAARNFSLLSDTLPRRARIVAVRDVRERVMKLFPLFVAGPIVRPLYRADTLYWSVLLFTSSDSYPVAERREIWGEPRSYFHRAGTAIVNARTGRVYGALDEPPEPVAAGWIRNFELPSRLAAAQTVQHALSLSTAVPSSAAGADTSFRGNVSRLYERMRSALAAGDLRAFGLAYDSLGAVVRRGQR